MARRQIEVQAGSGNVFADLGYPDAKERRLKVELALEVNRILGERRLAQERAAKLLGILQPHVSDLVRYRLNRFSVERLMDFLTRLGKDVEIRVAARPSGRRRAAVHVHRVDGSNMRGLKGIIKRPRKPVSVADMRKAVARRAGR
jgi:predicted XRE-type DNA-binding protein